MPYIKAKTERINFMLTSRTIAYLKLVRQLRKALGEHMTYNEIFASAMRHTCARLETRARMAGIDVEKLRAGADRVKRSTRLDTINDGPVIDEYKA